MATTKAIVVVAKGKAAVSDVPIPKVRDEWVLVKVKAVALNPTDWKHIDLGHGDAGSKIGCDYSGVVAKVGSKVTKFKEGDRIAGMVHGGNRIDHETGAFGEYIIAKECSQFKIPDNLTYEQAATLGVAIATCGQGLYKSLGLPLPTTPAKEPFPVLIYGGSTAMGVSGIQYLKASGLTVIATASPSNFEYLKSLGADAVFDYRLPTCGADIREFTHNKLTYAWDCAGDGEAICAAALSDTEPSKYGCINIPNAELLKAKPLVSGPYVTLAYQVIGEAFMWDETPFPAEPDEMKFATAFFETSKILLENGTLKPIRLTVNKTGSGLDGVLKGLDELRAGRVSGTKLVYTL